MKWVWGILILFAVALGSYILAVSSLRGGPQGRRSNPGVEIASTSLGTLSRNDAEGKILAIFGKAPEFSLVERSRKTLSKENLSGKPWIADFIFTRCAGQCPLMSLQMKKLQNLLGPETQFRFVSFTVDPERDTPEVLAEYADRYEADKDRWFFLTGPLTEINRLLKEFFLSPVEQPAMHSIRFILVDAQGQIRGYYDSSDPGSVNQLIHDARVIASPAKRGEAISEIASSALRASSQ